MGKKTSVNEMNYAQLLGDARTNVTKNDAAITELLFRLTSQKKWTHRQCLDVYESILRQYLDDEDNLQLLLASSGLMDGYKSIKTAGERREKYLDYLVEIDSTSKYRGKDAETVRKDEDDLLKCVSKRLEDDLESGTLSQLIEKWTVLQSEDSEKSEEQPSIDGTDAAGQLQSPPSTKIYITDDHSTNTTIYSQPPINIWVCRLVIPILLVIIGAVAFCVWFFHPSVSPEDELPPVEEIFATDDEITLVPNERYKLLATVLPPEAIGASLSFVSLNTDVVIVREHDGWLQALENHEAGGVQTADIIIQAESGATTTKTIAVDFGQIGFDPPEEDLDDFVPDFIVNQKIRIAGDTEWHNYVDAKVGDELEIQFEYQNTSENEHVNVAVRDILPANLGYIPGSTIIYNTKYPEGVPMDQNDLVASGIGIGTYGPNANAYIRFRVRVVDINLADGVTGLVNWSQASVNGVTLQDFATVRVSK